MSESRLHHPDGAMAEFIARMLPNLDVVNSKSDFCGNVIKWCMKNYDLVQRIAESNLRDDAQYCKLLEYLHDTKNVEAFGIVMAMRWKELQRK